MADDGVEWAVSEAVEDRDALLERLQAPAIGALPYPAFLKSRWCSKGHTLEEMFGVMQRQKAAMPGCNDPCTCGSGKKHKNCCGRRFN